MAKQPCCFAAPQSGAAKSFAAFRHHVIIIKVDEAEGLSALLDDDW